MVTETHNSWFTKKICALALGAALIIGGGSYYVATQWYGVTGYRQSDKPALVKMLKDDWYLMVDDVSCPNFPVDYTFDHRAAGLEAPDDSLYIFVYRRHGAPVGFATYHHESGCRARIQFLSVAKEHRGHGYAQALIEAMLKDAAKRGYCEINLVARVGNDAASKLYEKCGFHTTGVTDGFMGFERKLI